jgi:hypothetical protein
MYSLRISVKDSLGAVRRARQRVFFGAAVSGSRIVHQHLRKNFRVALCSSSTTRLVP